MTEIITDLDAKQLADRLTALELHSTSELARLEQERDEALSQIAQAENRAERFCQERDEAQETLDQIKEYGTEEINAAVELRQKLAQTLIERDEARENAERYRLEANAMMMQRDEARNAIVGWENKWKCAVEMAAKAEMELDEIKYSLKIREINEYLKYSKDRNEIDDIMRKLNFKL